MRRIHKRLVIWLAFKGWVKIGVSIMVLLFVILLLNYPSPVDKTWTDWSMPLAGKTIVIDAGHGGPDGGASSKDGLVEKDVSLAIALDLRDYLQQVGALVVMTREADYDLADPSTKGLSKRKTEDLHRRANMIDDSRAEILISIHLNSIGSSRWFGAQTFYYEPGNPDGKWLAHLIQTELKENVSKTERIPLKVDRVYLLKQAKVPAVLVEVGFLSNPHEALLLGQKAYQQKLATAIYRGVLRYYSDEQPSVQEAK